MTLVDDLLNRFAPFGVDLGLTSIQRLLAHVGNPQTQVPIVHVAGTNGKGSVCAYLSAILTQSGYCVGRYTSPHLVDWTECICLNEQSISPQSLWDILQNIQSTIDQHALKATQFEVITVAAWLYFAQHNVDIAIIEVGLGGRLDATNVCDRPLASVITSISRDHWQQLGDTLTAIATEKAGILKPLCPAFIGPLPPDAEAVVKYRTAQLNCPTVWVQPAISLADGSLQYLSSTIDDLDDDLESDVASMLTIQQATQNPPQNLTSHNSTFSLTYTIPLAGFHQRINSALAIAVIQHLQQQGWTITSDDMCRGLAQTKWPGRLQWITLNGWPVLVDGAHNEASAIALRHYVETLSPDRDSPRPIHWVMGMLSSKDHTAIFKALLRPGDCLSLVPIPDRVCASPTKLATLAQQCCPTLRSCTVHGDVVVTLKVITTKRIGNSGALASVELINRSPQTLISINDSRSATENGLEPLDPCVKIPNSSDLIVLCGSLYLLGHVLRTLHTQASSVDGLKP